MNNSLNTKDQGSEQGLKRYLGTAASVGGLFALLLNIIAAVLANPILALVALGVSLLSFLVYLLFAKQLVVAILLLVFVVISTMVAGLLWPIGVSGSLYVDADRNGIADPGDASLAAIDLQLRDSKGVTLTDTTKAKGLFGFRNVARGQYRILWDGVYVAGGQAVFGNQIQDIPLAPTPTPIPLCGGASVSITSPIPGAVVDRIITVTLDVTGTIPDDCTLVLYVQDPLGQWWAWTQAASAGSHFWTLPGVQLGQPEDSGKAFSLLAIVTDECPVVGRPTGIPKEQGHLITVVRR